MRFVDIEPSAPRVPTVAARFDGDCPSCDFTVSEGDVLTLIEDEWVCEDCVT